MQCLGAHVRRTHGGLHPLTSELLVHDRFLQPWTSQLHVLRHNAVATAPQVIDDALTVGGELNSFRILSERVLAGIAENNSPKQLNSATLRCFLLKQLRTPPPV